MNRTRKVVLTDGRWIRLEEGEEVIYLDIVLPDGRMVRNVPATHQGGGPGTARTSTEEGKSK